MEEEVTSSLLSGLRNYPYQQTRNLHGHQPSKMLEYKRVYCVGFSLIGHAFLKELGIRHTCISTFDHSYLRVAFGEHTMDFDPTTPWCL